MIDNNSSLLREAKLILRSLLEAGYEAYLVGGFVRDHLLHRPVHDIDIATSALPADVMRLFPRAIPTGIQHGTVTVISGEFSYEVTTFRREGTYQDHRRPDEVEFVDSLKEDLSRRDFTINAMALDIDGQVIDPFGGQDDLAQGILRAVGVPDERFQEDALRMLRCIRFAANYQLSIDDGAWQAIITHRELLRHIAMERVRIELVKTIEGADPERGVKLLAASGLLAYTKESLAWRPFVPLPTEADTSTLDVADQLPASMNKQISNLALRTLSETERWASLFLSWNHTVEEADKILRTLTFSNEMRSKIIKILSLYAWIANTYAQQPTKTDQSSFHRICTDGAIRYGRQSATSLLAILATSSYDEQSWQHKLQREGTSWLEQIAIWQPTQLSINGHDLMGLAKTRGPWIGELLHELTVDTALGQVENDKQKLLQRADDYVKKWGLL